MKGIHQVEMETAAQPIMIRLTNYRSLMYRMRVIFTEYFFDEERTKNLSDTSPYNPVVFDFSQIMPAMKMCLVEESDLIKSAQKIEGIMGNPSFVSALHDNILQSGLSFELQEENNQYLFKPEKPYKDAVQNYMNQFANALSIYRICLGICEVYCAIYEIPHTETHQNLLHSAENLKLELENGTNVIGLYEKARDDEQQIRELLAAGKVRQGMDSFNQRIEILSTKLTALLNNGADCLRKSYSQHTPAKLRVVRHRTWHSKLIEIARGLFGNMYRDNYISGSITIHNEEYVTLIRNEIDRFLSVAIEKTHLLKIELLCEAAKLVSESIIQIMKTWAIEGINYPNNTNAQVTPTQSTNNIYRNLFSFKFGSPENRRETQDQNKVFEPVVTEATF